MELTKKELEWRDLLNEHLTVDGIIKAALTEARRFMPNGFDPEALKRNDCYHDWEFKEVPGLLLLGFYHRSWPLVTVYVRAEQSPSEKLFTMAHEVGHHFLHALTGRRGVDTEYEADEFARRILKVGEE